MELIHARNTNRQQADGSWLTVHEAITVCQGCLDSNNWGYTIYPEDQPGDKCEVCGEQ
jgi:hypothetical protein